MGNKGADIVILTAGYGHGHHTAADGIQKAMERHAGDLRVEVADLARKGGRTA